MEAVFPAKKGWRRPPAALQPVKQESAPLRRKIIVAIRQAIETGGLMPGERLVEKDLCRDLNVSRTSLREALRELEAEGLLANNASRGLMVAQITRKEAENIYRVRGALESLVAEQFAANGSPAALKRLQKAVKVLRSAYDSGVLERILEAKKGFYAQLCAGAENDVVLEILERLNSRISLLRSASLSHPERLPSSIAEIEAILAAIKARDPATARAAAERHVARAAATAIRPNTDAEIERH